MQTTGWSIIHSGFRIPSFQTRHRKIHNLHWRRQIIWRPSNNGLSTPSVHSDEAPAPETASGINVVDQWSSGSEDGGSPIPAPEENLAIAEMWSDQEDQEEHSGDELARPSYEASADLSDR